jgi:1-acyl-sn-glycerol-3-phosphate acyltransferase
MILKLRSLLFFLWFAVLSVAMNVGCLPLLLAPRSWVVCAGRIWAKLVLIGLNWTAGLGMEVRGQLPGHGAVLLAVKHFSMWETIALQALLEDPAIVIKRELLRVPFYGWYCRKMEMIAVDRDAGSLALRQLLRSAGQAAADGRPIVIFPEGTRRKIGDAPDYKPGIAALYTSLGLPCVPVALNSGLYWQGFVRKRGTVVLEFLDTIPPGLSRKAFMAVLEERIEKATHDLVAEA